MIAEWMIRLLTTTALVAVAARVADEITRLVGRQRRGVWAAALATVVLLPVAAAVLPPWAASALGVLHVITGSELLSQLLHPGVRVVPMIALGGAVNHLASTPVDRALLAVWIVSSTTTLALMAFTLIRLRRAAARGARASVDGLDVMVVDALGPAVVGLWRPTIVVPRWAIGVPAHERALILRHEREHLAAGDALLLGGAMLPLVLMPWNLPLWWLHRRLRNAIEIDCDSRVLVSGADVRAYGEVLLRTAAHAAPRPFVSPALVDHTSHLEERILAMTTTVSPKHLLLRVLGLSTAFVLAGLAACDAADKTTGVTPYAARAVLAMPGLPVTIQFASGTLDLTDPAMGKVWHIPLGRTDALKDQPQVRGSSDSATMTLYIQSLGIAHFELTPAPNSR
jgi:beta-lactamase regulating signal transducer with metallopeptidase domain